MNLLHPSATEGVHRNRTRTDYSVFQFEDGPRLQDEVLQAHSLVPEELVIPLSSISKLDKQVTLLPPTVRVCRPPYRWFPLHLDLVALERQRDTNLGLSQVVAHRAKKASGNSKEAKATRARVAESKPVLNGMSLKEINFLIEALTKAKEGK